jgi:hypothetical protein
MRRIRRFVVLVAVLAVRSCSPVSSSGEARPSSNPRHRHGDSIRSRRLWPKAMPAWSSCWRRLCRHAARRTTRRSPPTSTARFVQQSDNALQDRAAALGSGRPIAQDLRGRRGRPAHRSAGAVGRIDHRRYGRFEVIGTRKGGAGGIDRAFPDDIRSRCRRPRIKSASFLDGDRLISAAPHSLMSRRRPGRFHQLCVSATRWRSA